MEHNVFATRRDFLQASTLTTAAASAALFGADMAFAQNTTTSERKNTMPSIKGTKTEKNLLKAFAGESQARNRYTFFSKVAEQEGYEHIAAIFLETAQHEHEHAKQFFQYLEGGPVEITATYPGGVILTTDKNLEAAAGGEREEWEIIYPEFAKVAKEEGFADVAKTFNAVAVAEKQHERRYLAFLEHLRAGTLFSREGATWRCRNCGFVSKAPSAPGVCPVCRATQAWFEILAENW
ncbi:MAG: rubrerythrin [Thermoguttaceae bacterium]